MMMKKSDFLQRKCMPLKIVPKECNVEFAPLVRQMR